MTLQTLLSSDDDEKEQLSSSTKHNRSGNNKTGIYKDSSMINNHIDL